MAYVPGCEHDVFISYAHRNNESLAGGDLGWVTRFKKTLQVLLGEKLRNPALWMDHELSRNRPLDNQLMTTLQRTAALVVILSQAYIESEWCQRERDTFLKLVADKTNAGFRVFGVLYDDLKENDLPQELRKLLGWRFWTVDGEGRAPRPLGRYPKTDETEYYNQISDLAAQMAKELKELAAKAGDAPERLDGPTVFLADVTDDLLKRQDEIRRFLNQAKINVLPQPQVWYPQDDPAALEQAMLSDLKRSKVFVQLLGENPGKKPPFLPQGYPAFRFEVARRAELSIVRWRSPDLDISSIDDLDHRKFLQGDVQACGFEEFKQAILTEVHREPKPQPQQKKIGRFVFVDADLTDRPFATMVKESLKSMGFGCALPLSKGPPEDIREDLEDNLRQCDGVLFLYGDSTMGWVRTQQRHVLKVMADRELPVAAICLAPPNADEKDDLDPILPNLLTIDCRTGFDLRALQPFVDRLGG